MFIFIFILNIIYTECPITLYERKYTSNSMMDIIASLNIVDTTITRQEQTYEIVVIFLFLLSLKISFVLYKQYVKLPLF